MTIYTDLKSLLTETDADQVLEDLIERAVDTVQRELDWYFGAARPAEEILDGTGTRALWLRQPPLSGLQVFSRSGLDTWTLVSASDYESGADETNPSSSTGRILFNVGNWTRGSRNYRATYNEGFTTLPGDIEQLLLDLVQAKWNQRGTTPGIKSERIGDYSYTRADLEETKGWAAVVARWKRGRI